MSKRLLGVEEAGAILGIGRTKMYQLVTEGKLRGIRIGRIWRVPVEAIDEWIASLVSKSRSGRRRSQHASRDHGPITSRGSGS